MSNYLTRLILITELNHLQNNLNSADEWIVKLIIIKDCIGFSESNHFTPAGSLLRHSAHRSNADCRAEVKVSLKLFPQVCFGALLFPLAGWNILNTQKRGIKESCDFDNTFFLPETLKSKHFPNVNNDFSLFLFGVSGVIRPVTRTPLGELQRSNTSIERMYK